MEFVDGIILQYLKAVGRRHNTYPQSNSRAQYHDVEKLVFAE